MGGSAEAKWVWDNCKEYWTADKSTVCEAKSWGMECYNGEFDNREAWVTSHEGAIRKCLTEANTNRETEWKEDVDKPILALEKVVHKAHVGKKGGKLDFKTITSGGPENECDRTEAILIDGLSGGGYSME